jgi:SpoVK/Ycf46/Vps4 family AAA+-type ATPase
MVLGVVSDATNTLRISFLYDARMAEVEEWVVETNHRLRSAFGFPHTPRFKVLVYHDSEFATEDVDTADFESVNIDELYNDDFAEIDRIIVDSIGRKESGIILLHGDAGTGKTTYIKHLISKFKEHDFIFVQNDLVRDLLKPAFVSFLLRKRNSILVIEDAEKVVAARDSTGEDSVVSTILQLTDGLFSDFLNTKIICTFNTGIEHIDKALLRKGRTIAKYEFGPLSAEKTAALARKLGSEDLVGSHTLAEIFQHDKRDFAERAKKPIGFIPRP